jgi:hypothetical protein
MPFFNCFTNGTGRFNRIYDLDYDAERPAGEGYFRERPRDLLSASRPPIGNHYRSAHRRVERWIDECYNQELDGYERYKRFFQVIVLENMEASHSDISEMTGHGRCPEYTKVALIDLIKGVVSMWSEGGHVSFVLVGRREDDKWWKKHFSELPRFPGYCLICLSLPDVMQLAHRILGET